MPKATEPITRDYLAEHYAAGIFGDNKWNVYFPHRDEGIDFIATKMIDGELRILPVQVKGLYPTKEKTDKDAYGFSGRLSQTHKDLVLVLVFFDTDHEILHPQDIAFVPFSKVKKTPRGFRFNPCKFKNGKAIPRRDHKNYFNKIGLLELEK